MKANVSSNHIQCILESHNMDNNKMCIQEPELGHLPTCVMGLPKNEKGDIGEFYVLQYP